MTVQKFCKGNKRVNMMIGKTRLLIVNANELTCPNIDELLESDFIKFYLVQSPWSQMTQS